MNESFASTTLEDASFLGAEILRRVTGQDLLGLYVTFVDRLATLNGACVSMVAEIVPDDPAGGRSGWCASRPTAWLTRPRSPIDMASATSV